MKEMRTFLRKSIRLIPWKLSTIKRLPLVALLQRNLLKRFVEGQEFTHTVDAGPARGLNYPIKLPHDKGIWTGTYEVELATGIAEAVKPGDICLDVGGWHGFLSGVMAQAGAAKVFILEPLPANAERIKRMIELNPNLPIELVETAVGDVVGRTTLRIMPETSMAKLSASSFQPDQSAGEAIEVGLETIDHFAETRALGRVTVVKIDVEGAEALVLQGGPAGEAKACSVYRDSYSRTRAGM